HRLTSPLGIDCHPVTAAADINRCGIRFDQLQILTQEGRFLLLGMTAFTLHSWLLSYFQALVEAWPNVRVKYLHSPKRGRALHPFQRKPLPSLERLPPITHPRDAGAILVVGFASHQARRTAIAAQAHHARRLLLPQRAEPLKCSFLTQEKRPFSRLLVVVLENSNLLTVTLTEQNNCQEDRLFSRRRSQ